MYVPNVSVDETRLTEKTFKAFAWHQLPIFVANYGHIKIVRDLGFDLFDDILDGHRYENLPPELYKIKIMTLLKQFLIKYPTIDDLQNLRNQLWPRLEYNNNLLASYVSKDNHVWE
jgi:hypothetical protein